MRVDFFGRLAAAVVLGIGFGLFIAAVTRQDVERYRELSRAEIIEDVESTQLSAAEGAIAGVILLVVAVLLIELLGYVFALVLRRLGAGGAGGRAPDEPDGANAGGMPT